MTSYIDKSHKIQNFEKKFYDFKSIYKIEDFFCFSDNNSYITLNGSRTKNKTHFEGFNTNEIIMNFKKNISSYLIIKKHYESNSNKYFSLISKLKYFNDKKKNISYSNNLLNDENLFLNEDHKIEKKEKIMEENRQAPLDYESYSNLKNHKENFIKCQFIIDDEVFQKKFSKNMSLNQLERKIVKKYEKNWQHNQKNDNFVEKLTKDFVDLMQKINSREFLIKLPKNMKPSMQNFNDFYFFKEDDEEHNEVMNIIESKRNGDSEFEENNDLDDLLIDQMINSISDNNEKIKIEKNLDLNMKIISDDDNIVISNRQENECKTINTLEINNDSLLNIPNVYKEPENIKLEFIEKKAKEQLLRNDLTDHNNEKMVKEDFLDSEHILIKKSKEENEAFANEENNLSHMENHSKMALIEKLLNSKNIFNEDLSEIRSEHFNYPKIPEDLKFSDENEKEIFEKIFYWLYEVELQVEKDKNDIQNYEKDYHMKFLDFLSLEKDLDENSKSSHGPTSSENDEEDEDEENDSEEG